MMKLFGFQHDSSEDAPFPLTEVTIVGSPEELRRVAEFLNHAAHTQEALGEEFGHVHLSDYAPESDWKADIIVSAMPK